MRSLLVLAALFVALPAGAVEIEWVYVGDPGNPPDTPTNCFAPDCGSVAYAYYISKYEITNAQFAEFLNAKAASDPLGLYNTDMGSDATFGGITRSGSEGGYTYAAKAGFESKPVVYVSFYDALRFSNWLSNGHGSANTENGAYEMGMDPDGYPTASARDPEAITFLPSENEWYKAAYYSPDGTYFDYPTGTDSVTDCVAPGSDSGNSANCYPYASPPGSLTDIGAYALSDSPYGTFDQGGNVFEWNEQIAESNAQVRGGAFSGTASSLSASDFLFAGPLLESGPLGFRVASLVPEPAQVLLVLTGGLVLAVLRTKQRR